MMPENSEKLTILLIWFGTLKYLGMLFSLCNRLASWQKLINNSLFDFLYCFVQVYLNDFLIYSKTLKDHHSYIWQVLEHLQEVGI